MFRFGFNQPSRGRRRTGGGGCFYHLFFSFFYTARLSAPAEPSRSLKACLHDDRPRARRASPGGAERERDWGGNLMLSSHCPVIAVSIMEKSGTIIKNKATILKTWPWRVDDGRNKHQSFVSRCVCRFFICISFKRVIECSGFQNGSVDFNKATGYFVSSPSFPILSSSQAHSESIL